MIKCSKSKGMSLIEIVIVMAIIGIIAAIALPRFNSQVLKTNRSDAFAALNEIMQAQERYATDRGTYTIDLTDLGYLAAQPSEKGYFTVSAATCPATAITQCVLLSAAAVGGQVNDQNDGAGGNMDITYDSRGNWAGR